jgi:agmatine/peptidylarginine deiminase
MKKNHSQTICTLLLIAGLSLSAGAQAPTAQQRQAAATALKNFSPEEIKDAQQKVLQRKPDIPSSIREDWMKERNLLPAQPETDGPERLAMPPNLRLPGEFEEVQAIVLTWPYFSLDTNNNFTEQLFPNLGPYYNGQNFIGLGPISNFVDTLSSSELPEIYRLLVSSISLHAEVWLNIWDGADSLAIQAYMASKGTPTTNTRFFVNPGNSIWYRDCGPVGFYYGPHDSIGFLDFEYYGGRPLDDDLPIYIGAQTGYPVYTTTIENEGGNILADGMGSMWTTTSVYTNNGDSWGQIFLADPNDPSTMTWRTKVPLNQAQVRDSLTNLLELNRLFVLPALRFDGGTGHIDLYLDMWDENTFVATQHPPGMTNNIDITLVTNNLNGIQNTNSYHGTPYKITRIPLPSKDNGSWYISGIDYENYTRTYSNHLIVNTAIIQPVYSDGVTGNVAGMLADLEILREQYPGYEIIPIDKRAFDGWGGSIHCITKQIPAENPLLMLHDPIRGPQTQTTFDVEAEVSNRSGISSTTLNWRLRGGPWNQVALSDNGAIWEGQIIGNPAAVLDTVEYYLTATSNNGKTISKPMTAPEGFYTFTYGSANVSIDPTPFANWEIGGFYPNPTTQNTRIEIYAPGPIALHATIYDASGRIMGEKMVGVGVYEFHTADLPAGAYYVRFSTTDGFSTVRKLIVR